MKIQDYIKNNVKKFFNKYHQTISLSCFCIAGVLSFNLIIYLFTSTDLAEFFIYKGYFSEAEFLLKNNYNMTYKFCRTDKCKQSKVALALQNLINLYYSQRDFKNIVTLYNKHIERKEINLLPTRIVSNDARRLEFIAYNELAFFYLSSRQYSDAKNFIDKTFKLTQKHPEFSELLFLPQTLLTNYYIATNKLDDAIENIDNTVFIYNDIKQDYIKNISLAKIYLKKENFKEAEKYAKLAYVNLPNYLYLNPIEALIETNNIYGHILEKSNNFNAARERFRASVSISVENSNNMYDYANVCSLYYLSKLDNKLGRKEFDYEYQKLSYLTKSLTLFKKLNKKNRYKKLEHFCEHFEYGL